MTGLLLHLLRRAPIDDPRVYAACRDYVNAANGDANDNPATNGEHWIGARLLPGCGTVFDVGANRGDWAASALTINPRLQLHCFEPSKATFNLLRRRGLLPSARLINAGLSSTARRATLFVYEAIPALNSLYCRQGLEDGWNLNAPESRETIDVIRLDDYCDAERIDQIDYLKIDVEGHELDVLQGGAKVFEQGRVQYGQFEYGGCNIDAGVLLKDLFAWFDAKRYRLFKLLPNRLRPVPRYDQRLENFQYQNWLFARSDVSTELLDGHA
jgi:FkbM family methyltransferase